MMNSESWNEPWWTVNPESGDFKMSTHVVYQSFESRHQGVKCVNSSTNRLLTFTHTGSANVHYKFGWLTGHTRSWDWSVTTCLFVLFQISRLFHWLSTFTGVSPSIFLASFLYHKWCVTNRMPQSVGIEGGGREVFVLCIPFFGPDVLCIMTRTFDRGWWNLHRVL